MESNRKPNSGENSKSNAPDRVEKSRPSDSHKASGSRSHSQSSKSKSNHREKERKSTNAQSSDRRYHQRSDYKHHRRHSNRSYAEATYEYNRNRSNTNRHYNKDWHRNTRPNRNSRWDSAPRYGNRTWQRNNLNQTDETFQNPPPEYWSNDPAQGNFQDFQNSVELLSSICNLLTQDNQSLDRSQDPSRSENFLPQPDFENQQYFDNTQCYRETPPNTDTRTSVDQGQNFIEEAPSRTTSENSSFLDRWQGAVDRFDERTEQRAETQRLEDIEKENSAQPQIEETTDHPGGESLNDKELPQPECQSPLAELSELITHSPAQTIQESLNSEGIAVKAEPEDVGIDKPTLPDALDLDFDCLNDHIDNRFPSISVIPISRLIKSELLDLNRPDTVVAPTTPARGKRTLKPNLVKRRKKSINDDTAETISENLVQRVADMDKVGIKNVINNSGTKYDAALKIQARKRLREEIRKQLKSMNFTPADNSENCVLVPDEIVDSMNIPAVILDEIRKAFGIVLLEDMHVIPDAEKAAVEPRHETVCEDVVEPSKAAEAAPSKSPDLMSRIKMLEEVKSQSEKPTPVKNDAPTNKEPRVPRPIIENVEVIGSSKRSPIPAKPFDEVMVIDSSSSSSSSSSSDGSDSDSSSTSSGSNRSTTSSYKRRRRKKRILEANVVGNFEKLVLPYLSEAQQRRYNAKYSKTTMSSLLFIHGICVSRINPKCRNMEAREKHKLKHNLTSADNATALEFLMKSILDLFERQKEKRRLEKEKSQQRSKSSNPVIPTKKRNDSKCNQETSANDQGRQQSKSANAAAKQHQSREVDEAPTPPQEGGANRNDGNFVTESANSAQGVARGGRLVAGDDELSTEYSASTPSRLWKSPGEKKCIEIESPPVLSGLGLMNPPLGIHTMDLDALKSQSSLGDEAVSSIREIDVKLMELHKRKMYIEEMILKLQKDKMEVDLWTMKLQNEKFIILNSALANASISTAATAPKIEPKTKPKVKTEKKTKPVAKKKLKPIVVRKPQRRCQNVIFRDSTNVATSSTSLAKGKAITKPKPRVALRKRATRQSTTKVRSEDETQEDEIMEVDVSKDDPSVKTEEAVVAERLVEIPQFDYSSVPNGNLDGWKLPITQIIVCGEAIVAASEDGNIYKFNIRTRQLESKFSKHTEAITQIFTCPREHLVYTTSLDGFLKKTSVENFGLELQSLNLQEPLQSIDIAWGTAFIGSRWGNIFTYDIKSNNLSESLLCSAGSSIIAIKATKEGPRKVLIVSSKGNQISFRDASSGLLLRSLDIPDNLHIYSILLDGGSIYCGTQRNEIYQYNFTTGERQAIFQCGNGAVSMKLYKEMYIFVGCYDGFVYVLDKKTGCQIGRFPGSGKMILALEIAGDKLITSAKDNTMQIIDIPKYIVTKVN